MQNVIISGNLAKDCEIVPGKEGNEFIRFDVAVNDGREKEEKPTYYTCRMKKTGVAEYLKKGRFVTVMGTLKWPLFPRTTKPLLIWMSGSRTWIWLP